jgi:hypothetical protein
MVLFTPWGGPYWGVRGQHPPMGALLEINRDFPFQIALPFDDAGMEVLEWLDGAPFAWDM